MSNILVAAAAIPALAAMIGLFYKQQQPSSLNPPKREFTQSVNVAWKYTNKLAHAKSPYLLQHAHNPVNWQEWGEEAFAQARKEGKMIFLSVGYSTCHWCHVMAHESFENEGIARVLNANFVCIKVDREERPDVDAIYMKYVQARTGSGGWPMSVWLTPDLKPIFGGTYYPPEDFKEMQEKIVQAWTVDHDKIVASGEEITRQLVQLASQKTGEAAMPDKELLEACYEEFKSEYEDTYGGFGVAPKFPHPVTLNFLLRYHARTGNKEALDMCLFTLKKMADGGMHDHLGGGFHRYSTDLKWHVPHFEKMLYDQALMACSYLEAFQITREERYAEVARDILNYVLRDMTGSDGQFFSAEDADSPVPASPEKHGEGAFYVWEESEIDRALDKNAAALFKFHYGVKTNGNVSVDPRGELTGKNVLIISHSIEECATRFGKPANEIQKTLSDARNLLFTSRNKRPRPLRDDKTIAAWNGLMISAFARAYEVLDDPKYLTAATRSARFLNTKLRNPKSGLLYRRYRAGEAAIEGFADDHAFLIQGLIDLYEASFDINHLIAALDLQKKQNELFWDAAGKGYFNTSGSDSNLLLRIKENYDGAEPSANSVSTLNLLRLSQMLGRKDFGVMADETIQSFTGRMKQAPGAMPQMAAAMEFRLTKPRQIVLAGKAGATDVSEMQRIIHSRFLPNKIVMLADGGEGQQFLGRDLEFIQSVKILNGKATAYVCENYVCQLPTSDLTVLRKLLSSPPASR